MCPTAVRLFGKSEGGKGIKNVPLPRCPKNLPADEFTAQHHTPRRHDSEVPEVSAKNRGFSECVRNIWGMLKKSDLGTSALRNPRDSCW